MSNNKQVAKNAIYNVMQFAVNFCISFFFTPYLIRTVGKDAYGFFPLINNMIGYTSIITTAVGGMAGRFITMCFYNNDKEGASYYFNTVLVANWLLSLLFTIVSIVCVIFLPYILTIPFELISDVRILFAFACASMIIGLASSILSTGTFVKNRVDAAASRSVITNLFRVALILLLFSMFKPSIVYMSISAFGAAILGVYYNFKFKNKFLPELSIRPFRYFKFSYLKELVGSSIWNSVNQLSFLLITQLDLFITNIFIGVSETADYSIVKMMPHLIQSLMVVLVAVFLPQFTILYAKGDTDNLLKEINKSIKLMGIASTLPIGFLMVYGDDFFNLWIPGQTSENLQLLSVLTLAPMVVSGCINTLFHVYTVTNRLKTPAIVLLINGFINLGIVFVLLKFTDLGVFAIPIASMSTLIIRNITFTPMFAAYCLKQNLFFFHKDIVLGCSSFIFVIVFCFLTKMLLTPTTWFTFIISGLIVTILSLCTGSLLYLSRAERVFVINTIKSKIRR